MAEKKNNLSLRQLIYNDKYLIIVSVLLAVLVWIVTSLNIGTDETKTIKVDVPIQLGDEVSEQLGMQYYSLQDSIQINVTISGAKYVIGQVEEKDLSIKFDTSNVNRTGEQTIPILVTNKSKTLDFSISGTYPSSIGAYFDVNESKTFDLYLKYNEKNTADGYVFGSPVMSEDKVIVSGPKTYVDKIDRTVVNVDFGGKKDLTEPYNADCAIDIEGTGVEASYLTITPRTDTTTPITTVSVTLPVLKEQSLPVSVDFDDRPTALPDDAVSVTYSRTKLNAGVLDSADISAAVIGKINFRQIATGTNSFDFDVTNLQGITVLDEDVKTITVEVSVNGSYEEKKVTVNPRSIAVEGVPDGYTATVKEMDATTISIIALKDHSFSASDIKMKCDVSEQNEDNVYPVTITLSDNASWVYGSYNATIQLSKK